MFRFFFISYLIINLILLLKFNQYTYLQKIENIEIFNKLPSTIYNSHIIQSLKNIKMKKPKEKSWNEKLITNLGESRYLNYGANLEAELFAKKKYCIKTSKAIKIFGDKKDYFQLSSNYKELYSSNRGLPNENCFDILSNSKLIANFDVLSEKNYLFINDRKIEINYDKIVIINPLILLLFFLVILFLLNTLFLLTKKNNEL